MALVWILGNLKFDVFWLCNLNQDRGRRIQWGIQSVQEVGLARVRTEESEAGQAIGKRKGERNQWGPYIGIGAASECGKLQGGVFWAGQWQLVHRDGVCWWRRSPNQNQQSQTNRNLDERVWNLAYFPLDGERSTRFAFASHRPPRH